MYRTTPVYRRIEGYRGLQVAEGGGTRSDPGVEGGPRRQTRPVVRHRGPGTGTVDGIDTGSTNEVQIKLPHGEIFLTP